MKKIICLVMSLLLVFCCISCSKKQQSAPGQEEDSTKIRVGYLNDTATVGIATMMQKDSVNIGNYKFVNKKNTEQLIKALNDEKIDIALLPLDAAVAAYSKDQCDIKVIDISVYNDLQLLSQDKSIKSVKDLEGKKLYINNSNKTDYAALRYLFKQKGVTTSKIKIEFEDNCADIVKALEADAKAVGLISQPAAAEAINDKLNLVIDCGKVYREYNKTVVSGVSVVRAEFLKEHKSCVDDYLSDHSNSISMIEFELEKTAQKVSSLKIIKSKDAAEKIIPQLEITSIAGNVMKDDISSFINIIDSVDKTVLGEKLPDDNFYYIDN